jgi:glutathione peroxidase
MDFFNFSAKIIAKTIDGKEKLLKEYQGQVVLVVNVASQCGFTKQYAGLEALYQKFSSKGFVILGFPCNQFGHQEPGSESEIQQFCQLNYGVTFPLFAKIDVNGPNTHPLFVYLKQEQTGLLGTEAIKWNFTKFLVDRQGHVVKRYAPQTEPKDLEKEVEAMVCESVKDNTSSVR